MKVLVYKDKAGKWRWHKKAANGVIVGASEQGYRAKWYCKLKARMANPDIEITVVNAEPQP